MLNKPVDLSVIILNYNTRNLILECLEDLRISIKNSHYSTEIIVVDNGSSDNSISSIKENYPATTICKLRYNRGFSAGNNKGIKITKGKVILLLNSDAKVSSDTIEIMINYMSDHPEVGVATCRLVLPDGKIDPACHRGFPTPWAAFTYFSGLEKLFPHSKLFSSYHLGHLDLSTIHEIDSPSGAFYLIRKEVIDQVGMLDEDYFMYAEDLDWSYRIKKAGWKIMYVPLTSALHLKKQSGRVSFNRETKKQSTANFFDTMKIFYKKHYLHSYPKPLMWLIFFLIDVVKKLGLFT